MDLKKEITEIIYKNSNDTSEGVLIDFKVITPLIENIVAIAVTHCCKSVKINDKQQNIEAITALTEVVKANNKLFGSERTMEIANNKIKELMQRL